MRIISPPNLAPPKDKFMADIRMYVPAQGERVLLALEPGLRVKAKVELEKLLLDFDELSDDEIIKIIGWRNWCSPMRSWCSDAWYEILDRGFAQWERKYTLQLADYLRDKIPGIGVERSRQLKALEILEYLMNDPEDFQKMLRNHLKHDRSAEHGPKKPFPVSAPGYRVEYLPPKITRELYATVGTWWPESGLPDPSEDVLSAPSFAIRDMLEAQA